MKKSAIGALALALPLTVSAVPESYTLNPYHTYPYFEIDHWGVSTVRGMFKKSSGKFTIDRAARTGSVELTVETASIDTGDGDKGSRPRSRDEHLRTADFFNVAEFPRMTFISTGVKFSGDNPAEIAGQLTLLGVTKPLTLKRTDFGMKYQVPAVGDELKIAIAFEAEKD